MATLGWLFLLAYIVAASYLVHEWAHAIAAQLVGWERRGWYWKLPWAVGVTFETNGQMHHMWIVALWGLAATSLIAVAGLYIGGILGAFIFAFNATILFVNCLPIKGTDGWHIAYAAYKRLR